jgi:spore coat protein H
LVLTGIVWLAGCGRQAPEVPSPAQPTSDILQPTRRKPALPDGTPAEPQPAVARQQPLLEPATITCQTKSAADLPTPDGSASAELKTTSKQVVPGTAPELRLRTRHDSKVQSFLVHLEIGSQSQDLTAKPEPPESEAKVLESELTIRFPNLPVGTLVRYWVEVIGPEIKRVRFPAADATPSDFALYVQEPLTGSKLPFYELKIEPRDLMALERSAFSNQTVPGTFIANGEVYDRVRVRYRGSWARSWPKKPVKIFFNKEKPFEGQHCLNLNSEWRDPALVREHLAYHVFAACGVPSPQTRIIRLHLNGKFRGLYTQVQQPDKAFVNQWKLKGASVYKAVSRSNQADERDLKSEELFRRHYEKQTQKDEGYGELESFCHELAEASDVAEFFNQHVNVEEFINYLAATVLIQNWDGFNKNHYLVFDGRGSKKWLVVPWDLDRTFGDFWNRSFGQASLPAVLGTREYPGITGWNRLEDRFLSDATLRSRFLDRLSGLLQTEFTEQKLFPVLDQVESEIGTEAVLDRRHWPGPPSDLHAGIEEVKEFVRQRRAYLLDEIPRLRRGEAAPQVN